MSEMVYSVIVKAAENKLNKKLRMINADFLDSLIHEYCRRRGHNGIYLRKNGSTEFPLFVQDINVLGEETVAELSLSLPIPDTTRPQEQEDLWELILNKIDIPYVDVRDGDMWFKVSVKKSDYPIKEGPITGGKRYFFI